MKKEIKYLCGKCFSTSSNIGGSDENGNCKICGADKWIEKEDFQINKDYIFEICESERVTVDFLQYFFIHSGKPEITITIRGGIIQQVYSNVVLHVNIVDFDNEERIDINKNDAICKYSKENFRQIY